MINKVEKIYIGQLIKDIYNGEENINIDNYNDDLKPSIHFYPPEYQIEKYGIGKHIDS